VLEERQQQQHYCLSSSLMASGGCGVDRMQRGSDVFDGLLVQKMLAVSLPSVSHFCCVLLAGCMSLCL
jgi:hypothetical protein